MLPHFEVSVDLLKQKDLGISNLIFAHSLLEALLEIVGLIIDLLHDFVHALIGHQGCNNCLIDLQGCLEVMHFIGLHLAFLLLVLALGHSYELLLY